ncbi:hypothetical protein ACWEQL_10190 [Kitasatospora sp. NPDC004240]
MANTDSFFSGFQVNRPLLVGGAVLTGVGALCGLTGTMMVCAALASAGRGWMRRMDRPPAEMAHRALHEAKVASTAGWEAWRAEHNSPN